MARVNTPRLKLIEADVEGFENVAFLLGLADEFDSRTAVSRELDLDGRVDVIVVEDRDNKGQKLHIYRSQKRDEEPLDRRSISRRGR
jgi:hypothetical protein